MPLPARGSMNQGVSAERRLHGQGVISCFVWGARKLSAYPPPPHCARSAVHSGPARPTAGFHLIGQRARWAWQARQCRNQIGRLAGYLRLPGTPSALAHPSRCGADRQSLQNSSLSPRLFRQVRPVQHTDSTSHAPPCSASRTQSAAGCERGYALHPPRRSATEGATCRQLYCRRPNPLGRAGALDFSNPACFHPLPRRRVIKCINNSKIIQG